MKPVTWDFYKNHKLSFLHALKWIKEWVQSPAEPKASKMIFLVLKVNSWTYYVYIWHKMWICHTKLRDKKKVVICCTEWHCACAIQNGCGTLVNNGKLIGFFHTCDPTTTLNLDQKRKFVPLYPLLYKLTKCHLNYPHFANLHKNGE